MTKPASKDAAAPAPEVDMTADEIEQWKKSYEPGQMQEYISSLVKGKSEKAIQVRMASAVLAKLSQLKDDPEEMIRQHGILYRWVWQGVANKDGAIRLQSMSVEDCASWQWLLQLNTNGTSVNAKANWTDWVSIKPSNVLGGMSLGVFAAREFPEGSTIGYYTGKITWTSDTVGTAAPSDDFLKAQGLAESVCASSFLNTQGIYMVVDPTMMSLDQTEPGEKLYMGMHYMGTLQLGLLPGSEEFEKARQSGNCLLYDDGCVRVCRNVSVGSELLEKVNPPVAATETAEDADNADDAEDADDSEDAVDAEDAKQSKQAGETQQPKKKKRKRGGRKHKDKKKSKA